MKPYYQDKWVTIYHGDCREILPQLPDKSVELAFADPPFNVGKKYGKNGDRRDDYYGWCESWIDLCFARLVDSRFYLLNAYTSSSGKDLSYARVPRRVYK